MFCPITKKKCLKNECALYDANETDCVLHCIVTELRFINATLGEGVINGNTETAPRT